MINNIIRGLLVALVGILLIVLNESVMPLLVRLLGVVFFLPAFISLVNLYMKRKGTPMFPMLMMNVINIGSVILGILLMLFPVAFLEFFVILLAVMLLCFSLLQAYAAISLCRSLKQGLGLLATPVLLLVMSIVLLFNPFDAISTATLIVGICLVVSGGSDIVISVLTKRNTPTGLQQL
jgi:uncharacterized membrane protein HdeD (DUF308 family)